MDIDNEKLKIAAKFGVDIIVNSMNQQASSIIRKAIIGRGADFGFEAVGVTGTVNTMISLVAPLSEGAEWFRKLYNREGSVNKVIFAP